MVSYLTQRAVAKVAFLILLLVTPFLAFSLFSPLPASGAVWYVSADGGISGDGTTWSTAFISIQQAVSSAREGDEIWVRHGTYPLSSTITVTKAVSLYGGFAGSETQRDQRDWTTNITTIDGQNSTYHCLYVAADATIDGFTITGGNANGETPDHRGGGLYMYYSSPEITNCTVTANSADYGGAVYNRDTSSTITNCIVSGNSAEWGGGIFNGVNSSPTITTCTFTANSATKSGGGVYNDDTSSPTITGCTFTDNEAGYAGGIFNDDDTSSVISRCTFTGNTASTSGGGIYNDDNASATITDCTFTRNSANEDGGGIKTYRASPQITHCTFSGNNAKYGGGMYNCQSSSTITSCIVRANSATASGGGMYNNESYPAITTCTVLNNTAKWGSGIFNDASSPTITACTIYGNSASNYGGAIRNKNASTPTITNSILWANTAPDGPEIYNDDTSTPTTTFCDIEGGYSGEGNINVDPLFVDPTKNDFHLQATSPCIDSGDNTASALPFSDSDGDARIIDGDNDGTATVDIGADEYILLVTADGDLAPLGNRDGIVNVGDALVALRFALLLEIPTQDDITHGDVAPLDAAGLPAPDGAITVGDALVILRMALSLVSLEPIKISGLWALYTTTSGESQEEGPMLIVVLEAGRTVLLEIMALDGTWITGTGTSSGTQIALSWQEADKTVFLTGTLTTDTMSGTWEDSSGDSGTWRAETIIETGDVQVTYPGTGNALIVLEVEGGIGSATLYGTETGQGPALPLTGFTIDTGSGDCVVSLDDQERPLTMTLGTMEVTFTYNQDDSFNYEMKENGVLIYSGAAISTGQEALSGSRSWSVDTAPSSAVRYYSALGLSRTGDLRSGDDKIQFEDLVKNETLATILEMRYGISSTH